VVFSEGFPSERILLSERILSERKGNFLFEEKLSFQKN